MAITLAQSAAPGYAGAVSGNPYTVTYGSNVTAGTMLVVVLSFNYGAGTVPSTAPVIPTFLGDGTPDLTLASWQRNNNPSGNKQGTGIWYLPPADNYGGSDSVEFTQPVMSGCIGAWAYEFGGTAGTVTATAGYATTTQTTAWNTTDVTATSGALLIAAICGPNGGANSFNMSSQPGSPWTDLDPDWFYVGGGINEDGVTGWTVTANGAVSFDGVMPTSQYYAGVIAVFAPAVTTAPGRGNATGTARTPAAAIGRRSPAPLPPASGAAPAASALPGARTLPAAATAAGAAPAAGAAITGSPQTADAPVAPASGEVYDAGATIAAAGDTPAPPAPGTGSAYDAYVTTGIEGITAPAAAGRGWVTVRGPGVISTAAPGAPPAPATGSAPAPVPAATGQVTAGCAAGAGQARRVAVYTVLPPVYMSMVRMMARSVPSPGGSQVAVAAPGSSQWTYLGTIAHVQDLKYSFVMPGGADKLTCTVKVPAAWRTRLFSPGWQVRVWRGGHVVWDGRLDEPAPGPEGWTLTAAGTGQRGNDFAAIWSGTWPTGQPDDAVNQAITRGLNWVNPTVGQPAWLWTGQQPDPGSQTLAAFLTGLCSKGTGTWYVNSQPGGKPGADLSLKLIPTLPDRVLLVTTPVPRTLGAMVNRLVIRYQVSADDTDTGASAVYAVTTTEVTADITAHQATEDYLDLSSAGTLTAGAAQNVGQGILGAYQRASYTGPFTAAPGQLLTLGGAPVDLGTDQAGTCVMCVLTDFGMGGEITPATPVTFPVAGYEYDDQHGIATLTPWQSVASSLSGLISAQQQLLRPAS